VLGGDLKIICGFLSPQSLPPRGLLYSLMINGFKAKGLWRKEELRSKRCVKRNTEKKRGKLHEVFEPSFDRKECYSHEMVERKLYYKHTNPCRGSCRWPKVRLNTHTVQLSFIQCGSKEFMSYELL
jgi:hypothetical protein